MEASEGTTTASTMELQSEEPLPKLAFLDSRTRTSGSTLDSDSVTEEAISRKLVNVRLKSSEEDEITAGGNHGDLGGGFHPLRPRAEDCLHFLRTGTCKYGLTCKFNHPLQRMSLRAGKEKDKDKGTAGEGISEKAEQIECKYYLAAGGCKYGESCKYKHNKADSEIAPLEFNFLGLPIRLGEKECPFYMRNGSCGYGARCKFHHPDPAAVGGYDPHNLILGDDFVGQFGFPLGKYEGESIPLPAAEGSDLAQAYWPLHMQADQSVPYQDDCLSFMPTMPCLSEESVHTPSWNAYQVPDLPEEKIMHLPSASTSNSLMKKEDVPNQGSKFPERLGLPVCVYFMRTGDCKYKSECWYHHPKSQAPKADCVLSDKGLPLRPVSALINSSTHGMLCRIGLFAPHSQGKKICRYYEQLGICKYGLACLFDHPVNYGSKFRVRR